METGQHLGPFRVQDHTYYMKDNSSNKNRNLEVVTVCGSEFQSPIKVRIHYLEWVFFNYKVRVRFRN